MSQNLILCGFMGCGKSTIGRRLATVSQREFVDMDSFIELEQRTTIPEIFSSLGESAFRQMETQAALSLSQKQGLVIACGGGTVLNPENVRLLKQSGTILLLDTPLAALQERLKFDTHRPLLQRPDRQEFITSLYQQRMPLYRQAADKIVPSGAPASVVVERILELVGETDVPVS